MIKILLHGCDSPEKAYVVDDYPYGFRLRTKIRYWIETVKGKGDRFVSQTLNPKTGNWNKPKKSTYSAVILMGIDENGHVKRAASIARGWDNEEKVLNFLVLAGPDYAFNEEQQYQIRACRAIARAQKYVDVKIVNTTAWTDEQRREHEEKEKKTRQTLGKVVAYEFAKLGEEK